MKKIGTALALISISSGVLAKEFSAINRTEFTAVVARVFEPLQGRWTAVEALTAQVVNGNYRLSENSIYSIDCRSRGIERVGRKYNLEINPRMKPQWAIDSTLSNYKDGFSPEKINHLSVQDFIARDNDFIKENASNEAKRRIEELKPFAPSTESAILNFGCLVVGGASESSAADEVVNNGGLVDVKSLICPISYADDDKSIINFSVRFSESTGFVQAQGDWVKNKLISDKKIKFNYKNVEFEIDRRTGAVTSGQGDLLMQGICTVDDGTRKF